MAVKPPKTDGVEPLREVEYDGKYMAQVKNTGGMLGPVLKAVERTKVNDAPPSNEQCTTFEGPVLRSWRKTNGGDASDVASLKEDGGQSISKKLKKPAGDVTRPTSSTVEMDSILVVGNTHGPISKIWMIANPRSQTPKKHLELLKKP